MLRAVLAVALAVALLGVAVPVVEDARSARSARLAEGELSAVTEATTELADDEEPSDVAPPRRSLRVTLPASELAAAPVDYVAIGGVPDAELRRDTDDGDVVAYRLADGPPRVRQVPVDVRVLRGDRVGRDDEPLVLRGDAWIVLSLVERDGDPTVLVERNGGASNRHERGDGGPNGDRSS